MELSNIVVNPRGGLYTVDKIGKGKIEGIYCTSIKPEYDKLKYITK